MAKASRDNNVRRTGRTTQQLQEAIRQAAIAGTCVYVVGCYPQIAYCARLLVELTGGSAHAKRDSVTLTKGEVRFAVGVPSHTIRERSLRGLRCPVLVDHYAAELGLH